MRKLSWIVMAPLIVLMLAACGSDDKSDTPTPSGATVALTPVTPVSFNAGPDLQVTVGGGLPGCSDPDSTDCPAPLDLDLDSDASAAGITIQYPARYFTAVTQDDAAGVPIEISPNDTYSFEQKAVFQVFFSESVEQAFAELTDPVTADWDTGTLKGTIAVFKDETVDPPVNTIVGAFPVDDSRVVVLRLTVDGKYGWDLFSRTYEKMLQSLTVTAQDTP
jgi:hypothetical protein